MRLDAVSITMEVHSSLMYESIQGFKPASAGFFFAGHGVGSGSARPSYMSFTVYIASNIRA
jgi:hypothetical protein